MEDINMIDNESLQQMELDNDTPFEKFLYQIDLSIETGDISYIQSALIEYKNYINIDHIKWANNIIIELLTEKMNNQSIF